MTTKLVAKKKKPSLQLGDKLNKPKVLKEIEIEGKGLSRNEFREKHGDMDLTYPQRKYLRQAEAKEIAEKVKNKSLANK